MRKINLDLCAMFGVKEGEHFWIKDDNLLMEENPPKEYYIKHNCLRSTEDYYDDNTLFFEQLGSFLIFKDEEEWENEKVNLIKYPTEEADLNEE